MAGTSSIASNSFLQRLWSGTVSGQEQLISNGGRFKPAFAERDKKQPMINLLRILST
jgi:hypothetical protein